MMGLLLGTVVKWLLGGVCISFSFSVVGMDCVQNFSAFVSPLSLRLLSFMILSISSGCCPSELFFLAFFLCS